MRVHVEEKSQRSGLTAPTHTYLLTYIHKYTHRCMGKLQCGPDSCNSNCCRVSICAPVLLHVCFACTYRMCLINLFSKHASFSRASGVDIYVCMGVLPCVCMWSCVMCVFIRLCSCECLHACTSIRLCSCECLHACTSLKICMLMFYEVYVYAYSI
jgi:hypothetical protein